MPSSEIMSKTTGLFTSCSTHKGDCGGKSGETCCSGLTCSGDGKCEEDKLSTMPSSEIMSKTTGLFTSCSTHKGDCCGKSGDTCCSGLTCSGDGKCEEDKLRTMPSSEIMSKTTGLFTSCSTHKGDCGGKSGETCCSGLTCSG